MRFFPTLSSDDFKVFPIPNDHGGVSLSLSLSSATDGVGEVLVQ